MSHDHRPPCQSPPSRSVIIRVFIITVLIIVKILPILIIVIVAITINIISVIMHHHHDRRHASASTMNRCHHHSHHHCSIRSGQAFLMPTSSWSAQAAHTAPLPWVVSGMGWENIFWCPMITNDEQMIADWCNWWLITSGIIGSKGTIWHECEGHWQHAQDFLETSDSQAINLIFKVWCLFHIISWWHWTLIVTLCMNHPVEGRWPPRRTISPPHPSRCFWCRGRIVGAGNVSSNLTHDARGRKRRKGNAKKPGQQSRYKCNLGTIHP